MLIRCKRSSSSDIWPIDQRACDPPEGFSGWPGGKGFALILTHDVESAQGQEKCSGLMELEKELGFRSSFYFVPERYRVSSGLMRNLINNGFEAGVHGLNHDGKLYNSRRIFLERAERINNYLKEWKAVGFSSPSMHSNLEWIHDLNIEYDLSTFDTDPFEPHPEGVGTIFPFWKKKHSNHRGYVELPYSLPQDFTLFVLMREKTIDIWKKKLDWVVKKGGMALMITHPDYMNFDRKRRGAEEYPVEFYKELLSYIRSEYGGGYWNPLAREMACYWRENMVEGGIK